MDLDFDKYTMDELAYTAFESIDGNVLNIRSAELLQRLKRLDEQRDEDLFSPNAYDAQKAEIMARIAEINDIKREAGRHANRGRSEAQPIGSNGNISMFMGKDFDVWVETNGVKTVHLMTPRVSTVMKWKRILGIK